MPKFYSWGNTTSGALGNGTSLARTTPTEVLGLSRVNVVKIVTGSNHSLALDDQGNVYAAGSGGNYQFGNNSTASFLSFTKLNINYNVVDIVVCYNTSFILDNAGNLYSAGLNTNGQCGVGNTNAYVYIWTKINIGNSVIKIAAGDNFALAIDNTRTLYFWGLSNYGESGNGTASVTITSPAVIGITNDWKDIEAGAYHVLALKTDNSLYSWGYNGYGQLGLNSNVSQSNPVRVGTATDWLQLSAAANTSLVLKNNGTIYGCGDNSSGQLGNGATVSNSVFTQIPNKQPQLVQNIAAGNFPQDVAVNSNTNRIYVPNWGSNSVSVINAATNSVVATVGVGANPWGVAVNSVTNRIYVANYWSNNVSVINGATNTVVATVAVGANPLGVAVSDNDVIGYANLAAFPAIGNSYNIYLARDTNKTYRWNGSSYYEISILNRIYVANYWSNNVSVIDANTNTVVATVAVGSYPYGVAVNSTTNRIYVANYGSNNVKIGRAHV